MAYNNVGNLISGLGKIIFNVTGFTLFFVSVVLTIISGMNYIIKNKKLF